MQRTTLNRRGITWNLLIGLVIGIIFFVSGLYAMYMEMRCSSWPAVDGKVEMSIAKSDEVWRPADIFDFLDYLGRRRNLKSRKNYEPEMERKYIAEVSYSYKVNGQEYKGKDRTKANRMTLKSAELNAKIYSIGKKIKVFHNPSKPEESLLTIEAGVMAISILIFGVILILGCLYFIYADKSVPGEYHGE